MFDVADVLSNNWEVNGYLPPVKCTFFVVTTLLKNRE